MLDSDKIIIQEGEGYILYSPLGNLKLRILKAKEGYKVFSSNCSSEVLETRILFISISILDTVPVAFPLVTVSPICNVFTSSFRTIETKGFKEIE